MVFSDDSGRIYDHPQLEMAGVDGEEPQPVREEDLIPLPRGSDVFILPGRSPIGIDPKTGKAIVFDSWKGKPVNAVAAFISPGYVQTMRPAYLTRPEAPILPLYAYTAIGFSRGRFWVPALRVDPDPRQDPWRFNLKVIEKRVHECLQGDGNNRLLQQLKRCALEYSCRAAQNFFLGRWEAPLPTSPICNARCLGCLSWQPDGKVKASQERLDTPPTPEEVAAVALHHIRRVNRGIVSFGQGCEGEPLLMGDLLEESIRLIRRETDEGTINLNTNGSLPEVVERLCRAGLDSIRVTLNSPRVDLYNPYFRPRGYELEDVIETLRLAKRYGKHTSINLLVFPGVTDTEEEVEALASLVASVDLDMIQLRNLNIDPELYMRTLAPEAVQPGIGLRSLIQRLKARFPHLRFGYFNPPKETFR